MRHALLFLVLAAGTLLLPSLQAKAEIIYPFCFREGGFSGSVEDCSFETMAQCLASASGRAGSCNANPRFDAALKDKTRKKVIVR